MKIISSDEAVAMCEQAMDRDPRHAPFGFFSGGSFVLDSARVFAWFDSMDKLTAYLREVEPAIYKLDELTKLQAYQKNIAPILADVETKGFSQELLARFNTVAGDFMVIDWWGHFEDLLEAKSDFGKRIVDNFNDLDDEERDKEGNTQSIQREDMDDFIEYLKTCGC